MTGLKSENKSLGFRQTDITYNCPSESFKLIIVRKNQQKYLITRKASYTEEAMHQAIYNSYTHTHRHSMTFQKHARE